MALKIGTWLMAVGAVGCLCFVGADAVHGTISPREYILGASITVIALFNFVISLLFHKRQKSIKSKLDHVSKATHVSKTDHSVD
jgi:hypothetical protein